MNESEQNNILSQIEQGLIDGWIIPTYYSEFPGVLFIPLDRYDRQIHGRPMSLGKALEYCQAQKRKNNAKLN